MGAPDTNLCTLDSLNEQRTQLKDTIVDYQKQLATTEQSILHHPDLPSLKARGVTHCGTFKVTTGHNRRWNQDLLALLYHQLRDESEFDMTLWPFKTEFKEQTTKMDALKLIDSAVVARIDEALTVTDKKPYFTAVEPKEVNR